MTKKLVAKVGEYQKDGQTKGRYVTIGVILSNDNGEYAILDPSVNLAGALTMQNMTNHQAGRKTGDKLMVSIFENDNSQGHQGGGYSGGQSQGDGYGAGGRPSGDPDNGDPIPFEMAWQV